MQIKTDGLVIRELNVGETDRILTILTREKGVVRASAKGARNLKSRFSTVSQLFSYAQYTLFKGREKYIIDEADPISFFIGVRSDIEKLALAQYFAQLLAFLAPEEENAEIFLRLILNSLHFIETGSRPLSLVKAAFEMRLLTLAGYMPDLMACQGCGAYEDEVMYLLPLSGTLLCGRCIEGNREKKCRLSKGALAALRHTVYADFEKLFSFTLPSDSLGELEKASEEYLLCRLERTFPTLEFYKDLYDKK